MTVHRIMNLFLFILIFSTFGVVSVYGNKTSTTSIWKTNDVASSLVNLTEGNDLWSLLMQDCKKPTLSCVRDNIYNYLNNTLNFSSDVRFTSFLNFAKNTNNYETIARSFESDSNDSSSAFPEIDEDDSPIQEMSRSLHDSTVKFLMTHDMEFKLPEPFFHGAVLRISPRNLDDSGATVKLEVMSKEDNEVGDGRLFFKKIKKFINEKLIYALLAILLVIKLLAVKLLFILPLIVGAATAKKLLIKVLLFLFPALHHLFKFCAYYPTQAKYHHHKHLISHIHSVAHPHKHGPPSHGHHHHHDSVEVIAPHGEGPPSLHHGGFHGGHVVHDDRHDLYEPYDDDLIGNLYPAIPGLGNDIISHRNDPTREENEIMSWGQPYTTTTQRTKPKHDHRRPLTPSEIEAELVRAEKEALIKAKLQKERKRIHLENLRLQDQLIKEVKIQEKLKQHAAVLHSKLPQLVPSSMLNIQKGIGPPPPPGQILRPDQIELTTNMRPVGGVNSQHIPQSYLPQQQIQNKVSQPSRGLPQANNVQQQTHRPQTNSELQPPSKPQPVYQNSENVATSTAKPVATTTKKSNRIDEEIYKAASITYDKFYSPILQKIDKVLQGLGFNEEPCRERLICSMYKNPTKFSPHSNLISAELSRDSSELQKPTSTNAVVIRFYKYVQAARDGQDGRDCLRLYPTCAVNTDL